MRFWRAWQAIGVLLCLLSIAGCRNATGFQGAAPQPGVLRFASTQEPDGLNPLISSTPITSDLSYLIFSFFFDVDDESRLVPDIATRVPTIANGGISKDGKTIVYRLRKGVQWQDGAPLTARDVIFTYRAIMNPRNDIQGQFGYDHIADVTAPDDYTVVVRMKRVFSPIVSLFMCLDGDYPILPAHLLAKYKNLNHVTFNDLPVGSGPFRVTGWSHGNQISFEANPHFWRGAPQLKKIVLTFLPGSASIVDGLRSGRIDAWFQSDPSLYPELVQIPGYRVAISPANAFHHLDFNLHDALLKDVRVRRAIEVAIDRRRIISDLTHDVYQPTDSDQPFASWAYELKVPHVAYNPSAARRLLHNAGFRIGADGVAVRKGQRLALEISYLDGSQLDDGIADIVRENLGAIGIQLAKKARPAQNFLSSKQAGGIVYNGLYQLAAFSWAVGVDPDDSWLYACNQMPPDGENSMFWCDPKVDAAEIDSQSTFDVVRRKRDYTVIQNELAAQVPMIFLFSERRADVYPEQFSGFRPAPTFAYWNAWQWAMY